MGFPLPLLAAVLAVLAQELLVGPGLPSQARLAPAWLPVCLVPGLFGSVLRIVLERRLARGFLPGALWRGFVLSLSVAPVAAFAVLLVFGRWEVFVRARLVPRGEFLELLLILAPYLLSESLARWTEEGIVRRLRHLGYGSMQGFGISRLRDTGFFLCLLLLPLLWDLLRLHPDVEVALDEVTLIRLAAIGGFFVLFALFVPDVFRLLRGARRLPDGAVRQRLAKIATDLNFRFKDILVWDTGGEVTNAAIVGPLSARRYVVLTDRLITSLDEEARDAVFAHEAGHALRHHGIHLLALFVVLPLLLLAALERIGWFAPDVGPPWWAVGGFGVLAILVLRRMCHRFEVEADFFAAAALGGVEPCVHALETLAGQYPHMRNRSSFRHPSLARRVAKLELAAADRAWFRTWRAKGFAWLLAGYLGLGALLGLELDRVVRRTPLDLAAFWTCTGRTRSAAQLLLGVDPEKLDDAEPFTTTVTVEDEEQAERRDFLVRALRMMRSVAEPGIPRPELLRRLRILAPRKGVRALETGDLPEAADWLELAVSLGGARRDVRLLRHLCLALSEGDEKQAEYYRSYLLDLLGEGRLRDAVVALELGK